MATVSCSCGGENERCFKCDGRGWYDDMEDGRDPLKAVSPGAGPSYYVASMSMPKQTPKRRKRRLHILPDATTSASAVGSSVARPDIKGAKHTAASLQQAPGKKLARRKSPANTAMVLQRRPEGFRLKLGEEAILMSSGGDTFPVTYPADRFTPQAAQRKVSQLLAKVRRAAPLRWKCSFRAQYETRLVHLKAAASGLVFLKDLLSGHVARVEVDARGAVSFTRRMDEFVDVLANNPHRDSLDQEQRLECNLDATRDYWQIRDHGRFGSYPSHDDYDQ